MSAREQILANVRRRLGRGPLPEQRVAQLEARIAAHARNLIPQRALLDRDGLVALFVQMAEEVGTTFGRVRSRDEIPAAVVAYLKAGGLPLSLTMSPDPALAALPWHAAPELRIARGAAGTETLVGVTPSFAGVAETGTLVLAGGPERPATLNFLPDTHVVILNAADIVSSYEDALGKLRASGHDGEFMPRTLNFVTGPSRTADIALTIVRGAHGPRRLHVVLIERESS
ncbi:MAG: lactate utilization protein [Candidatus Eremiobacteraeota bacterium]|nr:lactate utilization protein [Candidatus Eremiobacteraeota bacterium]MBV8356101.1 lactate utilization protein [Candidatus Eremiobacteraeota bacterium]